MATSFRKLGCESVPGESHLDALSRGEVYTALATLGHDKTHHEAIQRFQAFLSDKNTSLLSADMKKVCIRTSADNFCFPL